MLALAQEAPETFAANANAKWTLNEDLFYAKE